MCEKGFSIIEAEMLIHEMGQTLKSKTRLDPLRNLSELYGPNYSEPSEESKELLMALESIISQYALS